MNRRSFFMGLVAAPAVIVTPGLLMPVRSWAAPEPLSFPPITMKRTSMMRELIEGRKLFARFVDGDTGRELQKAPLSYSFNEDNGDAIANDLIYTAASFVRIVPEIVSEAGEVLHRYEFKECLLPDESLTILKPLIIT